MRQRAPVTGEGEVGILQGDLVGLYTSCVRVSLETGEVVEQNIVPATTHCHPVFVREWTRLLQIRYNSGVRVRHGSRGSFKHILLEGGNWRIKPAGVSEVTRSSADDPIS